MAHPADTTRPDAPPPTTDGPPKGGVLHLDFLDGIRGFSAIYVLLHHAFITLADAGLGQAGGSEAWLMKCLRPLVFGRFALVTFIVLSGYCLMLPVIRKGGVMTGGFWLYLKRRARRILPPYFVALGMSMLLLFISSQCAPVQHISDMEHGLPSWGDFLAHLLLVHNLVVNWSHSINPPMWSVATEWQIYFFFPLMLLPIWQRWGMFASVVSGLAVGLALHGVVPMGLGGAAPWFIGFFAMGMAGAVINFSKDERIKVLREKVPWGRISFGITVVLLGIGLVRGGLYRNARPYYADTAFGVASMAFIIFCAHARSREAGGITGLLLRFFSAPWLTLLGAFSYSLYLTHYHLLDLAFGITQYWHLSHFGLAAALLIVFPPIAFGLAYLFHLGFERPFMPGPPKTVRQANAAAEVSPVA